MAGKASLVDLELKDCQNALENTQRELVESGKTLEMKIEEIGILQQKVLDKGNEIGINCKAFCTFELVSKLFSFKF